MKRKVNLRLAKHVWYSSSRRSASRSRWRRISALSAWFSDDAAHLHEKEGREQTMPRIGWQGKNTDFTKLSISLSTAASHRRRLP